MQVRLVDAAGDDVLAGDAGEIWVKGPNVFAGYWERPEATAAALTADGWLRTGDIGVVDDDGFLYLVDRVKDLIIVSGFNVYPAEVEEVLLEHPSVEGCGRRRRRRTRTRARRSRRTWSCGRPVGRGGRRDRLLRRPPRPLQVRRPR